MRAARRSVRCEVLLAVALAASCFLSAPIASAQYSSMSTSFISEAAFSPDLSRMDLEVFVRVLSLKPDEQRAMHDLYQAYADTLKVEGAGVRAYCGNVIEESEIMGDQRLLAPAEHQMGEWEKRAEALKKGFIEDLRVLLTKEQEARWPLVERELRRLKTVREGRIAGESVDLVRMVAEVPEAARASAAIPQLLERYSEDLDRALVARAATLESSNKDFHELVKADPKKARQSFDIAYRARAAVRDVNERYVRQIADELSPEAREKFKADVFNKSYPPLVRPTRGEKYIRAAGELASLTAEQKGPIKDLIKRYEADRWALLRRAAEAARAAEPDQVPADLAFAIGLAPAEPRGFQAEGLPPDSPAAKLKRERWELDKSARGKIDALLTAAQKAALPDLASDSVQFFDYTPYGL